MNAMTPLQKTKAKDSRFETAVILGAGYSARLAAIALDQCCEITAIVGQPYAREPDVGPKNLKGQRAHSHVFLPRLEQEMQRIDPTLLPEMADLGFRFVTGSNRLPDTAPDEAKRLFATRWQFDSVIETLFKSRVSPPFTDTAVTGIETAEGHIQSIALACGDTMEIEPKTLVIDAMGAQSPIMKDLGTDATGLIDEPGDVAYITQFFRTTTGTHDGLPDPLIDCPHQFGPVRVLLYPGADGWFSVSLAVSLEDRALFARLRKLHPFMELCNDSPEVAQWLASATPVGPLRVFINPRNRWNVPLFQTGEAPDNYVAVGDALTSMLPTLGANCSFSATHIRIARDLLCEGRSDFQTAFAQEVEKEQRQFFEKARATPPPEGELRPYADCPENRFSKRTKRRLKSILGLDRSKIEKQLVASSSLK